jgi:uracil-DNA glycosylase
MLAHVIESLPAGWRSVLADRLDDQMLCSLDAFVARERAEFDVYPPPDDVFAALRLTPFESVQAVILGQDPYHGPGEAHGLAFSVRPGAKLPPSLRTVLDELETDLRRAVPRDGSLEPWARHGVLLLNTLLTVRRGRPRSHEHQGWEELTGAILAAVATKPEPIVFLLWGTRAQALAKRYDVDGSRHIILASTHPSPRSARRATRCAPTFVGSAPFRRANEELEARDLPRIEWDLAAP